MVWWIPETFALRKLRVVRGAYAVVPWVDDRRIATSCVDDKRKGLVADFDIDLEPECVEGGCDARRVSLLTPAKGSYARQDVGDA